jgi:hypothetical protein
MYTLIQTPSRPALVAAMALLLSTQAMAADQFAITRWTIDGGGTTLASGGHFELSGTLGQPEASGPMRGFKFTLTGGFWFESPPGDCNTDGGVDLIDYADLEFCLYGPGGGLIDPSCRCFDWDQDLDIDLFDFAEFQVAFIGN